MPTPDSSRRPIDLTPYAGRWIALVRDHVSGVGLTPAEARQLAKALRPKEEPLVMFVPRTVDDKMKG